MLDFVYSADVGAAEHSPPLMTQEGRENRQDQLESLLLPCVSRHRNSTLETTATLVVTLGMIEHGGSQLDLWTATTHQYRFRWAHEDQWPPRTGHALVLYLLQGGLPDDRVVLVMETLEDVQKTTLTSLLDIGIQKPDGPKWSRKCSTSMLTGSANLCESMLSCGARTRAGMGGKTRAWCESSELTSEPTRVPGPVRSCVSGTSKATRVVADGVERFVSAISGFVVTGAVTLSRKAERPMSPVCFSQTCLALSEVAGSTLVAGGSIGGGAIGMASELLSGVGDAVVIAVSHKHGEDVGEITKRSLESGANLVQAGTTVHSALSPTRMLAAGAATAGTAVLADRR